MKYSYIFALILAAVMLFGAAGATRLRLSASPDKCRVAAAGQPAGNQPFVVLAKIVLGGFSGMAVDILWMRLISLQAEGKVFEIVQLADWISKLEPHFTAVWAFHAWNMAYNISILYTNPEHRRLWINNGIQLLRDEGIRYNPSDPVLYRELGWIYQHKIGQTLDDMHFYYKIKLAAEMEELFGGPEPDYGTPGARELKMREEYKLLPEIMQAIDLAYGPLDWRLPETHALYWAFRGLQAAGGARNTETIYCDHMIIQSMAAAFLRGRLLFDARSGIYAATPRLDLLPKVRQSYKDAIRRQDLDLFKESYAAFLSEAVFICHVYGADGPAQMLFEEMLAQSPAPKNAPTFAEYLARCEQIDIAALPPSDALAWIEGLLYQYHASSGKEKPGNNEGLRQKAFTLWQQYAKHPKNARNAQMFPVFELIDRLAMTRAAGTGRFTGAINPRERTSE